MNKRRRFDSEACKESACQSGVLHREQGLNSDSLSNVGCRDNEPMVRVSLARHSRANSKTPMSNSPTNSSTVSRESVLLESSPDLLARLTSQTFRSPIKLLLLQVKPLAKSVLVASPVSHALRPTCPACHDRRVQLCGVELEVAFSDGASHSMANRPKLRLGTFCDLTSA